MGGRIASQVVAQGTAVEALALFAYPLHPPGSPDRRRDKHLPEISVPTLFCSGTRDSFGSPNELKQAASTVGRSRVHLLEGADHGFRILKSSGRTEEDVWEEAAGWSVDDSFGRRCCPGPAAALPCPEPDPNMFTLEAWLPAG